MHTSASPRSAHSRCTCSHRGPVGSHATVTAANPFLPAPAPPPSPYLTQPERLHPHRPARHHPRIMINHRDRLLILRQVDPDHRAATRQHRPQPLPPRIPPPVPPASRAATLTHRTSPSLRLGHQARTTAPGGRSGINHTPAEQPPLARCPITTPQQPRPRWTAGRSSAGWGGQQGGETRPPVAAERDDLPSRTGGRSPAAAARPARYG